MEVYTTTMDPTQLGNSSNTSLSTELGKFESGNIAWVLASTALVWLMIPGLGYFYSGLSSTKNALSLIMLSCWSIAVVSIQWFLFGYSITFSKKANFFIGNFDNAFLSGVLGDASIGSDKIPDLAFCVYQAMFAAITPALVVGAAAERGRFFPTVVFIFLWSTFVYDFIACWTWNPSGWSNKMGGLDFAGGTPVHISSGAAALAFAIVLGHRSKNGENDSPPHNMSNVTLGTALLWFGWFGFNGGSALAGTVRATMAIVVSNLAASSGGITWALMDYYREKHFSAVGFCTGAITGLVCITPGSGFVAPASSIVFGVVGAFICNICVGLNLNKLLGCDDALDVFAVHGIGGFVGNILTGIFADKKIAALDGTNIDGGCINGNWIQVAYQLADSMAGLTWSFCITYIILFLMNKIPGLNLRVSSSVEKSGLDKAELGAHCYYYVENMKCSEMYAIRSPKSVETIESTVDIRDQPNTSSVNNIEATASTSSASAH